MEIGLGIAAADSEHLKEEAIEAEALGFDYLCAGEHVLFHGPTLNAFVSLAVVAGVTSRIKLLSGIVLLPLYPAALVAKMAAVLDLLSGGRFNLGVGSGGEFPPEFAACGVPLDERGARMDEGLEVIQALLSGRSVTFHGRFADLDSATLSPGPLQDPLPIWVAGRSRSAMVRAARHANVWLPYMYSPRRLGESMRLVAEAALRAGRDPHQIRGALMVHVTLYNSADQAKRVAAETLGRAYQQDFAHLVDHVLVAGDPGQCRARLAEYRDAGAEALIFRLTGPAADRDLMLRLLVEEVLPQLRSGK